MTDQARMAARLTTLFHDETFQVLGALAKLLRRYESVRMKPLILSSGLPESKVSYEIDLLLKHGACAKLGGGYRLNMLGLDTLSLHEFASSGLVSRLGPLIAKGKESDVYEVVANDSSMVLKFFRIGRISFRQVERKRPYHAREGHRWLLACIRSAVREASVLRAMEPMEVPVPRFVARRYHANLMGMELAIPLYKVKELDDAEEILMKILDGVRDVYNRARLINGDLSEYNILITPSHRIVLIDWPQARKVSTQNSELVLKKDVANLLRFFRKRFGVVKDEDWAMNYVLALH
jgi:RIO kinase 2